MTLNANENIIYVYRTKKNLENYSVSMRNRELFSCNKSSKQAMEFVKWYLFCSK